MTTPAQKILERLEGVQGPTNGPWMARCPAHRDRTASLRITEKPDGRVIFHCHAGCGGGDVVEAVGLRFSDLKPERCTTAGPSLIERNARKSLQAVAHTALVTVSLLNDVARKKIVSEKQVGLAISLANEIQNALAAAGLRPAVVPKDWGKERRARG
jgi:hypothetical protein